MMENGTNTRPRDDGEMGPPSKRVKVESESSTQHQLQERAEKFLSSISSSATLPSNSTAAQENAEMRQNKNANSGAVDEVMNGGAIGTESTESDFAKDQDKEKAVGIRCTVNTANEGFEGTNKQRYVPSFLALALALALLSFSFSFLDCLRCICCAEGQELNLCLEVICAN